MITLPPLASLTWQVHVYGAQRHGVAEACANLRLPLYLFAWRPEMRQAGLLRGALYLVRPDGYVALAESHADPERLRAYFRPAGHGGPARRVGYAADGNRGPARLALAARLQSCGSTPALHS
jgi:hypothetical protein